MEKNFVDSSAGIATGKFQRLHLIFRTFLTKQDYQLKAQITVYSRACNLIAICSACNCADHRIQPLGRIRLKAKHL